MESWIHNTTVNNRLRSSTAIMTYAPKKSSLFPATVQHAGDDGQCTDLGNRAPQR